MKVIDTTGCFRPPLVRLPNILSTTQLFVLVSITADHRLCQAHRSSRMETAVLTHLSYHYPVKMFCLRQRTSFKQEGGGWTLRRSHSELQVTGSTSDGQATVSPSVRLLTDDSWRLKIRSQLLTQEQKWFSSPPCSVHGSCFSFCKAMLLCGCTLM